MPTDAANNANFGLFLHHGATGTFTDAASAASAAAPVDIPGAAASLLAAGVAPGEILLLLCNLSPQAARAYLGAMYAGIVPVLLHESDAARLGPTLLNHTHAQALWTGDPRREETLAKLFPKMKRIVGLPTQNQPASPAMRHDDDLAALMPTSGSTGTPRLVAVTHGNLRHNTEAIIHSQNLTRDDRAMLILPVSYCFGASVLHSHLAVGGDVVFDRRFMFPNKVLGAIDAHSCTNFAGVPAAYQTLRKRSTLLTNPPPSLRRFLQAGGPLDPDAIDEIRHACPNTNFYVMYGATEATARLTTLDPADFDAHRGSVGKPLDHVELRIVDNEGSPLPAGETGTVLARGASITPGYFRNEDATRESYRDGWLITGDLGFLDDQGYLTLVGRTAHFLKIRGLRVSFREIEQLAKTLPGVEDVATCAMAHEDFGETIALFLVAQAHPAQNDHDTLRQAVRDTFPPNWTVGHLEILTGESLPRTTSGKLDRPALRDRIPRAEGPST